MFFQLGLSFRSPFLLVYRLRMRGPLKGFIPRPHTLFCLVFVVKIPGWLNFTAEPLLTEFHVRHQAFHNLGLDKLLGLLNLIWRSVDRDFILLKWT